MSALTQQQVLTRIEESDRFEARRARRKEIEALKAISPTLPEGYRATESRRRIVFGDGQSHARSCECSECTLKKAKKQGPLRKIIVVLRSQASLAEPAVVELECGHTGMALACNIQKRVRCLVCREAPPTFVRKSWPRKPKESRMCAERQDDGTIALVRRPAAPRKVPGPGRMKLLLALVPREDVVDDGDRCGGRGRLPNGKRCPGCGRCLLVSTKTGEVQEKSTA
jgi:hypothetical protein